MKRLAKWRGMRGWLRGPISTCSAADYQRASAIQAESRRLRDQSDDALAIGAEQLRRRVVADETGGDDAALSTAFALVTEAVRRVHGLELFDVQLLAGLALARGSIAEMQTGEGKTLAAAPAAFWASLSGHGVHVATPNAYLAQRDADLLRPVFDRLGVSVGLLTTTATEKAAAYRCDITYGAGYEFGFDYLRDQLTLLAAERTPPGQGIRDALRGRHVGSVALFQRPHAAAIVDEIDSVLIDEACLPLVISDGGGSDTANESVSDCAPYHAARDLAESLVAGRDYSLEPSAGLVQLTDAGSRLACDEANGGAAHSLKRPWPTYVEHALLAKFCLHRDEHYVVENGQVLLVDESTGRIFSDRKWRDGVHQAIEAKEGLAIRPELRTAGRISRQRFFRRYESLCGMTGTATDAAGEFWRQYRLGVVCIPPRLTCQRKQEPTRFFRAVDAKLEAIAIDVVGRWRRGQPVLIGARTIENSRRMAMRLTAASVPFRLLNGVQDAHEAAIIAQAGKAGAVTIATNMAGRGTDIRLGRGVVERGGLHVIGLEPHASVRIDRQLFGRCGRQGDPGSCQLFVSAEDDLLVRHDARLRERILTSHHERNEVPGDFTRELSKLQRQVESRQFARRKELLRYDDWLEKSLKELACRDA